MFKCFHTSFLKNDSPLCNGLDPTEAVQFRVSELAPRAMRATLITRTNLGHVLLPESTMRLSPNQRAVTVDELEDLAAQLDHETQERFIEFSGSRPPPSTDPGDETISVSYADVYARRIEAAGMDNVTQEMVEFQYIYSTL